MLQCDCKGFIQSPSENTEAGSDEEIVPAETTEDNSPIEATDVPAEENAPDEQGRRRVLTLAPPIAPYVPVWYTALHNYRYYCRLDVNPIC